MLTSGRFEYWDIYDQKKGNITGSYSFNADGSCFYYSYKQGHRTKLYDDDLVYPHTWKVKRDSTLYLHGLARKILHYTSDTFLLVNLATVDTILLVKSKK